MCLGIPMQVISCDEHYALCANGDEQESVDISLVGQQPSGNWLLVFLGAAREVLTAQQAEDTINALKAVEQVMRGETRVEHLFADLIEREPQLPEHLREAAYASTQSKEKQA